MQEKDFDQIIDGYLNNTLGNGEKKKFDEWLDSISDEKAIENISKPELQNIGNRIHENLIRQILVDTPAKKTGRVSRLNPLFKIAAAVLLFSVPILLIGYGIKTLNQKRQLVTVHSGNGKISKVILPDASIVWLKGASSITYPAQFNKHIRSIDMKGEALFEITKDKAHPFVIRCGSLVTEVLGTSFNIKQQSGEIEVRVLTGRVHLTANNAAPVTIYPLQKAVFHQHKSRILKNIRPDSSTSVLTAGTEYNMKFYDTPVNQVVTRIEKKFDVHITTKKSTTNTERITADLTDQSLKNSVTMISQALNTPFTIEN